MKKIVMLDAYNLIHRARSGFTRGDYAIVYNFFRGLRPLIEMHNPDKVYFVLEGAPAHRTETMAEYKADRVSPGDSFHRQKKIIIDMVTKAFPFEVCKADDLECDDLIGNLARHHDALGDECVVISGDSDFILSRKSLSPTRDITISRGSLCAETRQTTFQVLKV